MRLETAQQIIQKMADRDPKHKLIYDFVITLLDEVTLEDD